ncbi:MAG: 3-deoxy-manno-octulosonate cytidylyltransferase [Gammaproteobacteria bacterium]
MNTPFKIVVPARYASTRLPGKPLLPIAGKAMILHVCERAMQAGPEELVVATDDQRIFDTVTAHGFTALLTCSEHQSGTERIAEVARLLEWDIRSLVVNVQGDEPLLPPEYIKLAAQALAAHPHTGIATLAARINSAEEIFNPHAVKVVCNKDDYALYFSRAPIPWDRECFKRQPPQFNGEVCHLRHIGLYAYTVDFLHRYVQWTPSPLESIEALEQLRILWHGEPLLVKTVAAAPEAGVDTEADLSRVEKILAAAG